MREGDRVIFTAIKNWIYDKNRYYFFTGANNIHTNAARDELESHGVFYAMDEVYNWCSEDNFNSRLTVGLGCLSIVGRIKVRFILWLGGVEGKIWYTE